MANYLPASEGALMAPDDNLPENPVQCPNCDSDTLYRYGKSKTGKQRYLCLMCNRQFTSDAARRPAKNKPACPACGGVMHIYKREPNTLRYRCADYPNCRTFLKVKCGNDCK